MCGIAGIVAWDERFRVTRETLSAMSARVAHRGPDGHGLWFNRETGDIDAARPQAALAHRRLAILDPDPRADQPFTDGQGRWITFNGEIYNFLELRAELKGLKPDYEWRTDGDTEVLLGAYAAWGEWCLERLNGMFAFAVWDENQGSLFLARDRMGQKPLYVAYLLNGDQAAREMTSLQGLPDWHGGEVNKMGEPTAPSRPFSAIAFASELPALRPLPWVGDFVSGRAVVEYLRWGYIPKSLTIFAGIHQVSPGTAGSFGGPNAGALYHFHPGRRYKPTGDPVHFSDIGAAARTRSLVSLAVTRQLVSDVPLGCFLSGGVDSSVVAAAAQASLPAGQRLRTFSIGFDDPRYDESAYAQRVAEHLGTDHRSFVVRPDAAADLPDLARAFGEPFGDSSALPTHYLSRETRRHVKVALSGDGGDELFAGYDRYRAMRAASLLRTVATPLPWMALAPLARLLPGSHPKSAAARVKRFAASLGQTPARRYSGYLRLMSDPAIRQLLAYKPGCEISRDTDPVMFHYPLVAFRQDALHRAMEVDRCFYLPWDLLTKVDRASMLHALEVRSPFMDHELVTFAAGLSTGQLLRGGPKRMLREAFAADLPDFVFKRKKMGFAVPIGEWFRTDPKLRAMLHDHLSAADSFAASHFKREVVGRLIEEHESLRADHSQRLYALLMLELWWRTARR